MNHPTKNDCVGEQLRHLNLVKNKLMQCREINYVIKVALQEVQEQLSAQVCSVFLFSKDGFVRRAGIKGIDKYGNIFGDSWFSGEFYFPGTSFSARSIPTSTEENGYGEIVCSNRLTDFQMKKESELKYIDKLGSLKHGVSVPLSGKNRTFGAIEIINKLDNNGKYDVDGFSRNDISWLMNASSSLSSVISSCKRFSTFQAFETLNRDIVKLNVHDHSSVQGTYNKIANFMTQDFLPYAVCILRRMNNGYLEFEAISHPKTSNILRDDSKRKPDGILGKAYNSKKPQFVSRISERNSEYHNIKWIEDNGLVSHACYPLVDKYQCVGTISVFTKYEHKFYEDDMSLLQTISSSVASFITRVNLEQELIQTKIELRNEQDVFIKATYLNVDDDAESFIREISHRYKHELISFQDLLFQIQDCHSSANRDELIKVNQRKIERRIREISNGFKSDSVENVDVNKSIKNTIKLVKMEKSEEVKNIEFANDYGDIPLVPLNHIEIESIVYNLLINAIRAITISDNKNKGLIEISTEVRDSSNIQISLSDNGVGIAKEHIKEIFTREFTTDKDKGTGIGLFITKKVVDRYGGTIKVHSQVAQGTTFIITIPFKL